MSCGPLHRSAQEDSETEHETECYVICRRLCHFLTANAASGRLFGFPALGDARRWPLDVQCNAAISQLVETHIHQRFALKSACSIARLRSRNRQKNLFCTLGAMNSVCDQRLDHPHIFPRESISSKNPGTKQQVQDSDNYVLFFANPYEFIETHKTKTFVRQAQALSVVSNSDSVKKVSYVRPKGEVAQATRNMMEKSVVR